MQLSLASLSKRAFLAIDQSSGFNMLHAAVYEGNYPTVVAASVYIDNFLEQMAMVRTLTSASSFPGKTALDIVSDLNKEGHAQIRQIYLDQKGCMATITELHKCADDGDVEKAVELVLKDGIDVNTEAEGNRTPLLWASLRSSSLYIKTLIDLGADTAFQREDQCTPLMMATHWNNYMAVYHLSMQQMNADVSCSTGHAALHVAVMKGFFHISNLLVRSRCNVTLKTKSGKTPLRLAVQNGHRHLVRLLLENNADANMRDESNANERLFLVRGNEKGRPAWYYIMVERSLLGLFLKRTHGGKLDVNNFGTIIRSGLGEPPSEAEITKNLNKSSEFRKDPIGKTPLHIACEIENGNLEVIELLVKYGGEINARDGDGFTPLQTAAILGKMQTVTKLVELKADVNLTTKDGKDAADLAQMNEEPMIEEYLKSRRNSLMRIWNSLVKS